MMTVFFIFFLLLDVMVYSQNTSTSLDKIYFNMEDLKFDNIKDAEIEDFRFVYTDNFSSQ